MRDAAVAVELARTVTLTYYTTREQGASVVAIEVKERERELSARSHSS